jgi:hypothetical protein
MAKAETNHLSAIFEAIVIVLVGLMIAHPAFGQAEEEELADDAEVLDEPDIDVQGSIDVADEQWGIVLDGDLRLGFVFTGDDFQGIVDSDSGHLRARWRLRSVWGISERFRAVGRVSGICSAAECDPDFVMQPDIPTPAGLGDGQITIDSLFLQWFRTEKFNVAVGRMETKFVARGGVYAKSLDRNDSNNLRINWTDGLHATYKAQNGWNSNVIMQYNSADGPSNVRRFPLDFSDSGSTVSTFVAFENVQPKRRMVQRALDISYLPSSLRKMESAVNLRWTTGRLLHAPQHVGPYGRRAGGFDSHLKLDTRQRRRPALHPELLGRATPAAWRGTSRLASWTSCRITASASIMQKQKQVG